MATDKILQNRGVGRTLLFFAETYLQSYCLKRFGRPEVRIWCNARTGAVPFYSRMGYGVISDEFMIEGIGPHYKMEKKMV